MADMCLSWMWAAVIFIFFTNFRNFSQGAPASASLFNIGKHNDDINYGTRRFFKGAIDEVRIWNRALCMDEIMNNMNCELNPSGQTVLLLYIILTRVMPVPITQVPLH